MPFALPPLPWPEDGLEPHMSAKTLGFHHGKHHAAYVNNLNGLIEGTPLEGKTLEDIILETANDAARIGIFNNAAQAWNHDFFWKSMKPGGGGRPEGDLLAKIEDAFGSFENFSEAFAKSAATLFGAGWVWLVEKGGRVELVQTRNADNPMTDGAKPLFTLDVWEHAYYLDYQNRRPDFAKTFLESLVNWDFAAANLG